jgi:stage V sporulation protein G
MYRLPDAGNLRAFVDVSVDDALIIRGVRVLKGTKGLFVSLPREQGKDSKWYDQVVCKRADTLEALAKCVLEEYNGKKEEADVWNTQ